jgi:hypothetical protein
MKSYLNFTFQPGFSVFVIVVQLITIVLLSICYLKDNPVLFIGLMILYSTMFLALLAGTYLRYLEYRERAPRVRVWNERKQRLEEQIL